MAPGEALLSKKLDELESEVHALENPMELHFPRSFGSKLSFLKSLLAAETGSATAAGSLSHIAARVSALESFFSGAEDPKVSAFGMKQVLLIKNLQELESMAKEPFWHPAAKIRSKIDFTKSLLAAETKSEDLSSIGERLAAVEDAFGNLDETDGTQPSCSFTSSRQTDEAEEEEAVALSLRRKIEEIEKEVSGDDCDDVRKKIAFLKSILAEEKAEELDGIAKRFSSIESEFTDRNRVFDDANGGNVSSPCSCTSSCFDGGEEKEKKSEDEENSVSGVNETDKLVEEKSETPDSGEGSVEVEGDGGKRRFGKLRGLGAMVGVFAVAAIGVVVGIFFSEEEMHYLVPT